MNVTLTLNSGVGIDLGPNFNLTTDLGFVDPLTATLIELLAGVEIVVDNAATEVTITSIGNCTNSLTLPILEP